MMSDLESMDQMVGSKKSTFPRLMRYLRPHWRLFLAAFVLLLLGSGADVSGPYLTKIFIDKYLAPRVFPWGPVALLAGVYLGLHMASVVFNYLQTIAFQSVALRIIHQLRLDVFTKVQDLSLSFFDKMASGALVSRITNDTEAIKELFVNVLSAFLQNIVFLLAIYVAMLILDARLAVICFIFSPIIAMMMILYRKWSSAVFHRARRKLSQLNAYLSETLQGMYIVQAMVQETRVRKQFGDTNHAYTTARMQNVRLNSLLLRPLVELVYVVALVTVLGFFGVHALSGPISIGVLYAFVNYLDRFFEPVNMMMTRLNVFQQAMVSAERVFQLMDSAEVSPRQDGTNADIVQGEITFQNVSFSYDGTNSVLEDISFTARPGQTVALVGHTGSGKSTIANLLLRFYPVTRGTILIDGQPLQSFSNEELRRKIGLVLQDPFLFYGDVNSNIRFGNENLTNSEIHQAAQDVQADKFIERLPTGYEEPIRERGATFSSGQRQLISFARTMARNPKILVLDEATASVDTETEQAIQTALATMRKGRTTIAIAHRLSTIQDADCILVLHHGRIVERGTHNELLVKRGLYHTLFELQQGYSS